MIVILTGAVKNIGDFLIGERAKKLLKAFVDDDIVEINRFEPLDKHLEIINQSDALILCGGPAYANNLYPNIYPLVEDLQRIKVPIIPFGLGWSGTPFGQPNQFSFTPRSYDFLKRIHNQITSSSCRDIITKEILYNQGFSNVTMTGCPVWYDLASINKKFKDNPEINRIVITTGARADLWWQTIRLLRLVKSKYKKSKIILSYHRGILPSAHTPPRKGLSYTTIAFVGRLLGAEVKDVSSDLKRIRFYDDCDLHIGYRVHAHLYFLSKRIPSILINEDGRGLGMVKSMGLPEFNFNDPDLLYNISDTLDQYKTTNFSDFHRVQQYIDTHFNIMKDFLAGIKYNKPGSTF